MTKTNLHLVGSAGSLERLSDLIINRLYWSRVDTQESEQYISKLGKVYDVSNANGLIDGMVIIAGRGRVGLYNINK